MASDILDLLSALAPVLGNAAGANQKQGNFEDITKQAAWNNLETNQLARDKFAAAAPGQRLATANKASMTKNFTPTTISWGGKGSGARGELPQYSGGAAGAARDPRSSAVADSVLEQELMAQMKGAAGGDSKMSAQPAIGQESLGAKLLGGAATGTSLLSALSKLGGGGSGGGGDIGKLIDMLRHPNTASEEDSPQHQEEDTRGQDGNMESASGGTAYGPDGQPLEKGFGSDWWQEGNGYDPSQDPTLDLYSTPNVYNPDDPYNEFGMEPGPLWGG